MKLVVIGSYPVDVNKIGGGVEAVTVYLIEGLQQISELDINVVTCRTDIAKKKTVNKGKVTIHYLPGLRHFENITFGLIDKYKIRKKIEELKPDIVHFQNHMGYAYVGLKPRYPIVATVHGIVYEEVKFGRGFLNLFRRFPRRYIEKITLRNINYIISISPYVSKAIGHLSPAKMYFIPNPVSNRFFQVQNNEIANRILFAAPISRLKNTLDLLKAVNILCKEIPMVNLRVAGGVRDHGYFRILEDYIARHKLESNVDFLGHLSDDELLKEYEKCCLLVLSSLQENSPMVILQAMAAGKPVVATKTGAVPYLVEGGETGFLVDCGDINGLSEKMRLLLNSKDLRRKFGKNAKLKAIDRFKAEAVARETYKVYQEVIKRET